MLRTFPALRHHRLRGKIHNIFRLKLRESCRNLSGRNLCQSLKLKVLVFPAATDMAQKLSTQVIGLHRTLVPSVEQHLQKCDPEKEFDPITMNLFIACVLDCDANLKPNSRYGSLEYLLDPSHDHMTDN